MSTLRRIHVVFKTHLDVGFTDLARNVVRTYTEDFMPRAAAMARELREKHGAHRFVWTTGSWLIHHALETGSPRRRRELETAIVAGDIVWHALPFTTHSELMDAPLFRVGLGLSGELDRRFGKKTVAAKMTDVPGHTRAIVPLLAEAGVELLHIGVNPASTPPDTPDAFRWRDASPASRKKPAPEVVVLYEKGDYGGLAQVPGCADALYFAHTGDNLGPCTHADVDAAFADLKARFPRAEILASTLDGFALALRASPGARRLPVVTQELGDTWIHGVGADPCKVSRFRALRAWRNGLNGAADGAGAAAKKALLAFDRRLLLVPEHTWGHDVKLCLGFEQNHDRRYAAAEFARARSEPPYRKLEASWREQRAYLDDALAALRGTRFEPEARAALRRLRPRRARHAAEVAPTTVFQTPFFDLALDPKTGAIIRLIERATGRRRADARHPLGLITYEVFSAADYAWWWKHYNRDHAKNRHWAMPDFLKPGVENAVDAHREWTPSLRRLSARREAGGLRFVADLGFDDDTTGRLFGAPSEYQVETFFPEDRPEISFIVQWFGKPATRVPEATWFSLRPRLERFAGGESPVLQLRKLGAWVDPRDVVRNGNRGLHAVEACRYVGADGASVCDVENPDAPLVAPGRPSLVRFGNRLPRVTDGLHFNLHNNTWGTNFPLWYEDDARFEFVMRPIP